MNTDMEFPDEPILEISFLSRAEFYSISFQNEKYQVVGRDKDMESCVIGIKANGSVYYLRTDEENACYIAESIDIFVKELRLFRTYMMSKKQELSENPTDTQLLRLAKKFRCEIQEMDKTAFRNAETYWSEIYEEMVYGICL